MWPLAPLLQFGPLGSPPGILITLLLVAAVVLVGRLLLALAWRLIVIGVLVVVGLWVLGALGIELGVLSVGGSALAG